MLEFIQERIEFAISEEFTNVSLLRRRQTHFQRGCAAAGLAVTQLTALEALLKCVKLESDQIQGGD